MKLLFTIMGNLAQKDTVGEFKKNRKSLANFLFFRHVFRLEMNSPTVSIATHGPTRGAGVPAQWHLLSDILEITSSA